MEDGSSVVIRANTQPRAKQAFAAQSIADIRSNYTLDSAPEPVLHRSVEKGVTLGSSSGDDSRLKNRGLGMVCGLCGWQYHGA